MRPLLGGPMDPAPLTLVSFAQPRSGAAVRDALCTLGYPSQVIPYDRLTSDPRTLSSGAVVFLLGSEACPREPVLAAVRCLQTVPSLAMVVKGECDLDPGLVAACCDCAQWPCAGDELAFRLGRLCRSSGDRAPAELDPVLIEPLAGLNLTGRSPVVLDAMVCLRRLLPSEAPVLIKGETGTG